MRPLRYFLAALSLCFLAGWFWLRKPYSPTDDLPPVVYTAFEVAVPTDTAGEALAQATRSWTGVTASTYNPTSGLLVVSHLQALPERELQSRIQILSSKPVTKKVFPEPVGPKCPIPQGALMALPAFLLGGGVVSTLGFLLLFFGDWKRSLPVEFTETLDSK